MQHSVASDLGLHCLLKPACPSKEGKLYGIQFPKKVQVFLVIKYDLQRKHKNQTSGLEISI